MCQGRDDDDENEMFPSRMARNATAVGEDGAAMDHGLVVGEKAERANEDESLDLVPYLEHGEGYGGVREAPHRGLCQPRPDSKPTQARLHPPCHY